MKVGRVDSQTRFADLVGREPPMLASFRYLLFQLSNLPGPTRRSLISETFLSTLLSITYELLSHAIERSNNIVSLFKELENIRIDA
jgi:hypothetical protein